MPYPHPGFLQPSDINGVPLAGAKLYFYAVGTTTELSLFTSEDGGTPLANPVEADSSGIFPEIFLNEERYKTVLETSAGVVVQTKQVNNPGLSNWVLDNSGLLISTGTSSAYAVDTYQDLTTPVTGDSLRIRWHTNSSGSPTLDAGGGPKGIRATDGAGSDSSVATGLYAGGVYEFTYDETLSSGSGGWLCINATSTQFTPVQSGIRFPATQNPSSDANTLDDYEEGTFTPTIVGTSSSGTGTYTTQAASYVKIGKVVTFVIELVWTAHTGTGNMTIAGLPFTSLSNRETPVMLQPSDLTAANPLYGYVDAAATTITLGTAASAGAFTALAIDTAATLRVSGSYIASA